MYETDEEALSRKRSNLLNMRMCETDEQALSSN